MTFFLLVRRLSTELKLINKRKILVLVVAAFFFFVESEIGQRDRGAAQSVRSFSSRRVKKKEGGVGEVILFMHCFCCQTSLFRKVLEIFRE
jgi:hypothetical protein